MTSLIPITIGAGAPQGILVPVAGRDGLGIQLSGVVATYSALPNNLGPADVGKSYLVQSTNKAYFWSGTAWPAENQGSDIKGDKGDTGRGIASVSGTLKGLSFAMTSGPTPVDITVPAIAQTASDRAAAEAAAAAANGSAATASSASANATSSANTASNSATAAGNSATAANNAATNATNSKNAAATSETNAAASATVANTSKNAAATSETNAAASATGASTSASSAGAAASNASTSATNAASSATSASNSAASAQDSADAAAQSAADANDIVSSGIPNATSSQKGGIMLAGDLGGSYSSPTVPGLANKQDTSAKGQPSGYAGLDGSGKVPAAQLPSFVDDVLEYSALGSFPGTGETGKIYTALDTNKIYRWSGSAYVEISGSPGSTDAVPEGSTNKYYTDSRAQAANASAIAARAADSAVVHNTGAESIAGVKTFSSSPIVPTSSAGDSSTNAASTAFVGTAITRAGATSTVAAKTANYTAAAGELVALDPSGGAFTITLPTAPANGTCVRLVRVAQSLNVVTVTAGGSDRINNSGTASFKLAYLFATAALQYSSGTWYFINSPAPCKFTWLVQSDTRATGYGDTPEGVYFDQDASIYVRFRSGTADASGSNTVALYSNTANSATGSAVSGGSTTLTATSAGAVGSWIGPFAVAAGTYLQVNVTAVGTTPGKRLYMDCVGVYL